LKITNINLLIPKASTRLMLVQLVVDHMSQRQIAAAHGISRNAVRERIGRVMSKLKRDGYPVLNLQRIPAGTAIPIHEGDEMVDGTVYRYCGGTGIEIRPDFHGDTCIHGHISGQPVVSPESVYGRKARRPQKTTATITQIAA
jgi:biotin operon repressor